MLTVSDAAQQIEQILGLLSGVPSAEDIFRPITGSASACTQQLQVCSLACILDEVCSSDDT